VEVTKILQEDNLLEIAVVNGWWNQLVGDPEHRQTQTNIRLKPGAKPVLSGLFGPVTLQGIKKSTLETPAAQRLESAAGGWSLMVNPDGTFKRVDMTFGTKRINIPWRSGTNGTCGPAWAGVKLSPVPDAPLRFAGRSGDAGYSLAYRDDGGRLTIEAALRNDGPQPLEARPHVRLTLGIDQEMKEPRTYFQKFFPTLLRCEPTHFWGYFQNPNGQILAIGSPDPIASWAHGYQGNGHRIATSHLDLLHALPLPPRHPQILTALPPGATQTWRIVLQPVGTLDEVPAAVALICGAPAFALDRTTAAPGETIELTVHYPAGARPAVTLTETSGKSWPLKAPKEDAKSLRYVFAAPEAAGQYTIQAVSGKKRSEALLNVRKPWGWYLQQARSEALRMQQKPMQHREGWLGFFSAYWAQVYYPDPTKLKETEAKFQAFWTAMVDPATGFFYTNKPTWPDRPQNSSWMLGLLTTRYLATGNPKHLQQAAKWGDDFIRRFQKPDGAFTHGKNSYGALTLGTKFLMELVWLEQALDANVQQRDDRFGKNIERHVFAIDRAIANLEQVRDLGHTEGEATYEDNQAGSAWSLLALHALNTADPARRGRYLANSLEVRSRHECLTQALVPDCRMRGGTLRWWESQYDILTTPNMMNSPHGWTMRSQFGAFYLYLLTGEERFLNVACNTMGTCVQAIDQQTGTLRWAYVPDPYIEAQQFVPDPEKPGKGKQVPAVLGEQWLPMISDWWRVPEGQVAGMRSQGWSCDNDVHEHFRFLAEQFVPNAFVLERADGTLRAWNCRVDQNGDRLEIVPAEPIVSRVHLNLRQAHQVAIRFSKESFDQHIGPGMRWVGIHSERGLWDCNNPPNTFPEIIKRKDTTP
jgi:hypothetical protein